MVETAGSSARLGLSKPGGAGVRGAGLRVEEMYQQRPWREEDVASVRNKKDLGGWGRGGGQAPKLVRWWARPPHAKSTGEPLDNLRRAVTVRDSSGCCADVQWTAAGPGWGRATTEEEAQHVVPGPEGDSEREVVDSGDQMGVGEQGEAKVNGQGTGLSDQGTGATD